MKDKWAVNVFKPYFEDLVEKEGNILEDISDNNESLTYEISVLLDSNEHGKKFIRDN